MLISLLIALSQTRTIAPENHVWTAEIDAPIERVWHGLSNASALCEWKAPAVELELRVGGVLRTGAATDALRARGGDPSNAGAAGGNVGTRAGVDSVREVLSYEPGRMLSTRAHPSLGSAADRLADAAHEVTRLEALPSGHTRISIWNPPRAGQADMAPLLTRLDNEWTLEHLQQWCKAHPQPLPGPAASERVLVDTALVVEGVVATGLDELWRVFSTAEGWKQLGVGQAEVDLRVGGSIRTHYDAQAVLGSPGTIVHRVLTYEDRRMLATSFADATLAVDPANDKAAGARGTWVVITLTPVDATHTTLREAIYGWGASEAAQQTRAFFEMGNRWTLEHLQKQYAAPK
jgi:uncharacterized protein YndB with AHSA1/START domain